MSNLLHHPTGKIWLCFMTSAGKENHLRELIDPILPYIDGIVATFHKPTDSGYEYLESVKGDGEIVVAEYKNRHDFSRNHYLFSGKMQNGDIFIQVDDLERVSPDFLKKHFNEYFYPAMKSSWAKDRVAYTFYYYGKPFIVTYTETLCYINTPHESLVRKIYKNISYELSTNPNFQDEALVRKNIRPLVRKDPLHFVDHFAKYYVTQPEGSNTVLLGLEQNSGDINELFRERETIRIQFLETLRFGGYALNLHGLNSFFSDFVTMDPENRNLIIKSFLNREKILNDYYRLNFLKETDIVDSHKFSDIKQLPTV